MSRGWTTSEVNYLAAHCTEGAEAVAAHLGRSVGAVESCARRYGISLRRRWFCPRCSTWTFSPLLRKSGWCKTCSIEESRDNAAIKNRELRRELAEEERRIHEAEKERQVLYTDTCRRKAKLKRLKAKR